MAALWQYTVNIRVQNNTSKMINIIEEFIIINYRYSKYNRVDRLNCKLLIMLMINHLK